MSALQRNPTSANREENENRDRLTSADAEYMRGTVKRVMDMLKRSNKYIKVILLTLYNYILYNILNQLLERMGKQTGNPKEPVPMLLVRWPLRA